MRITFVCITLNLYWNATWEESFAETTPLKPLLRRRPMFSLQHDIATQCIARNNDSGRFSPQCHARQLTCFTLLLLYTNDPFLSYTRVTISSRPQREDRPWVSPTRVCVCTRAYIYRSSPLASQRERRKSVYYSWT